LRDTPGPAERSSPLFTSERPGYFLLKFSHPNILFSLIIRGWDREILQERRELSPVLTAAVKQIFSPLTVFAATFHRLDRTNKGLDFLQNLP
jgi:hypothetical protein